MRLPSSKIATVSMKVGFMGEEIHGAVPGDLLETVEFICDFGHSRADDCLCLVRVLFLWSEDCDGGDDAR
jgi:hypothetical protein